MIAGDRRDAMTIPTQTATARDPVSNDDFFRRCRHALGLLVAGMAQTLRIADGRTIRRWETGERDVPGPVWVALGFLLRRAGERALAAELDQRGA